MFQSEIWRLRSNLGCGPLTEFRGGCFGTRMFGSSRLCFGFRAEFLAVNLFKFLHNWVNLFKFFHPFLYHLADLMQNAQTAFSTHCKVQALDASREKARVTSIGWEGTVHCYSLPFTWSSFVSAMKIVDFTSLYRSRVWSHSIGSQQNCETERDCSQIVGFSCWLQWCKEVDF